MSKYRVRDDNPAGKPNTLWGQNLSYTQAHRLKERVAGARKSRTVMIEPMDAPFPPPPPLADDPEIAEAKKRALAAAAPIAAEAQRRADAFQKSARFVKSAPVVPLPPPVLPSFDEGDLDGDGDEPDVDVNELLDGIDDSQNGVDVETAS